MKLAAVFDLIFECIVFVSKDVFLATIVFHELKLDFTSA